MKKEEKTFALKHKYGRTEFSLSFFVEVWSTEFKQVKKTDTCTHPNFVSFVLSSVWQEVYTQLRGTERPSL